MKYGEIRWKIDKVVFKTKNGKITQHCETDEGKTNIAKMPPITNVRRSSPTPRPEQ